MTVGKTTYELPAFNFAIATMNPVELGQGTFPLSEAATDRFAIMVNIGYLPPEEEAQAGQLRLQAGAPQHADDEGAHHPAARRDHRARVPARAARRLHPAARRGHASVQPGHRLAAPLAVGAGRARRRPRRVAARDHRAGAAWPRCGRCSSAAATRSIRKTSRIWRRTCSATALARPACRQPRPDHRRGDQGHRRARRRSRDRFRLRTREQRRVEPLINLSEITEIELLILKRMREFTIGEHRSLFHGTGFDFVGLRDWQAGDRFEHIDWPQSSLTNFSPLIVREFEQPTHRRASSSSPIARRRRAAASTRRRRSPRPAIATLIARAIATIGMSAVFFQDSFGLITFDDGFDAPRRGAAAHRQGPGDPLPRRLSARRRPAGHQAASAA